MEGVMNTATESNNGEAPAAKKRKTKDLPQELTRLTEENFRKALKFRLETDATEIGGEVEVAFEVALDDNDGGPTMELDKLTADQLRTLCKNVGVTYVNTKSKFACRKALAILANHISDRERMGVPVSTATERASNNIVRLVNILFSANFYDNFIKLNDIKTRRDHEAKLLPDDFWNDVAEAMNGDAADDDSALKTVMCPLDPHWEEVIDLDLNEFDLTTSAALRKKFNLLLKVRKVMTVNMTASGEHDSDPYNFVDLAMKSAKATSVLTKIGCYYFFQRCVEKNQEIDDTFGDTMDEALKGNTNSSLSPSPLGDSASTINNNSSEKKRAYTAIDNISSSLNSISAQVTAQTEIAQRAQLIELAKSLGDMDMLRGLLATAQGGQAGGGAAAN
jgi:hypothetical protein